MIVHQNEEMPGGVHKKAKALVLGLEN